jgi:hypothetical protein
MTLEISQRLDFILPDFFRVGWASDVAKDEWALRFQRIKRCWREIEWHSVAAELRQCALIRASAERVTSDDLPWVQRGLCSVIVTIDRSQPRHAAIDLSKHRSRQIYVIGRMNRVRQMESEILARDHHAIGRLLGYPECCREFYIRSRLEPHSLDSTWAMMANSLSQPNGQAAPSASAIRVDGPAATNIFWRKLGIRLVPHLPCSTHCLESRLFAERLIALGRELGYSDEMDWSSEILSWPVEWSALHGITEIKTPVLRMSMRTDATANKYSVSWRELH